MLVEDDHPVPALVLRNIAGRDRKAALDASEGIGGGAALRLAKARVVVLARRVSDDLMHIADQAKIALHGALATERVEEGALVGDAVGEADDGLLADSLNASEGSHNPALHRLRR